MMSILSGILPIILKFVGWGLDKAQASKKQKAAYFNFIKALGKDSAAIQKLSDSYKTQRDANLDKIKKMKLGVVK